MSPIPLSKTKIETKLANIREAVLELEKLAKLTNNDFKKQKYNFAVTEHYLRRALEAVFDIAGHILSRFPYSSGSRPTPYKELAHELGKKGIINKKFVEERLIKMAGYRNRMIHHYNEINEDELLKIIHNDLKDFETYARAIIKVTKKPEKFNLFIEE